MSFFADILAGAVSGGAGGYIKDREEEDRLAEKMELRRLQQEQALQLQAQRQQDRIDMFNLSQGPKASGAGGTGGTKDFNLAALVYDAVQSGDPKKMAAVEAAAGAIGGDEARQWARYQLGGGVPQQERMPTEQDVIASMATDGKEYTPEPPKGATMGQREAAMGLQAFQRGFAIANDPGKYDDFTKGEAQASRNDIGEVAAQQAARAGQNALGVGEAYNAVTNAAKINPVQEEFAAIKRAQLAQKTGNDAAKLTQAEASSLRRELATYVNATKEIGLDPATKKMYEGFITEIKSKLGEGATATSVAPPPTQPSSKFQYQSTTNLQEAINKYKAGAPQR